MSIADERARGTSVLLWRNSLAHCIPPVPPSGYGVRTWRDDDAVMMPRLLEAAFGARRSTWEQLEQFWAAHPGIMPESIFAIDNRHGQLVATATARIDATAPGRGYVHLVATSPTARRCGLASLAVTHALQYLARHGTKVALIGTGAHRVEAIAMYVKLGFAPVLDTPQARAAWDRVRAAGVVAAGVVM